MCRTSFIVNKLGILEV